MKWSGKAEQIIADYLYRQIPKVLGNQDSLNDSFADADGLLDYLQYTRPGEIDGQSVPKVLFSGDQAKINAWRIEKAEQNTATCEG